MKYIRRTKTDIKTNFLKNLLIDRGIIPENDKEYQQMFFYPTEKNLLNPLDLDNMEDGFNLFLKHLKAESNFYFVVDSDADGFTSSAIFINYMENNLRKMYPNFSINYHIPDGKEHGLDTIMDILTKEKILNYKKDENYCLYTLILT